MNVCKWCMSGSAIENSILLSMLQRLNKIFNQFNQIYFSLFSFFNKKSLCKVSQANLCNMTFTAGNLFPSYSCIGVT